MKTIKARTTKTKAKTTRRGEDSDKLRASTERKTRLLIALLCIALSAFAVAPFFFMGQSETGGGGLELRMPTTHDMFLHYDQMRSFYNGLAAGEIYPRWEEETNRGFGAPTTSYYPPGIYYLTSALYAITRDWLRALLDAHLLMMIAAAAALYIYARQVMGRAAAVASMAAYIFLPYHMVDQYQRGAIAELLVFVWMPLMLLFGERLMRAPSQTGQRSVLASATGLAASYGAFLWSHPPTAYQFTLGFGVYVLVLSVLRREWKGLIAVGAAMALGIGLSAVYLLPAAIDQNLIHREYVSETWPYHKTYIFVHDLYNSDVHRGFFNLLNWIWITGTAVIGIGALALLWLRRRALSSASLKEHVALWSILGGLASFMMIRASMPIGKLIPKIDIGVFTWRMLAITTLVVALIAGAFTQAAIDAAAQRSRADRLLFAALAGLIIAAAVGLSAFAVAAPMIESPVFEPEPEHLNWATIPSNAPADPTELPDDVPQAELATEENGDVVVEEWKPQHRVVRADLTEDDELLIRTFNFPGWTAIVDGQQVPIKTSDELGDMEIELHAGSHRITLDFLETPVRRAFRFVTLGSFGVLITMSVVSFARRKSTAENESN